jgi:hypothetical protein
MKWRDLPVRPFVIHAAGSPRRRDCSDDGRRERRAKLTGALIAVTSIALLAAGGAAIAEAGPGLANA